ncbi:MAG: nucleotidyltransferase family protein [Ignavibacteriales bacterium]|nr:nucleotidyltransferase family protein [Ignavibacteriales bacterium]
MISGIILAAGSSRRMGSPKSLLKIGEKTFLQHIVDVLHSARVIDIVIILGAEAEEIRKSLSWFDGKTVVNEDWQKGQLTSIIKGIDALDLNSTEPEEINGAMICPVDHPLLIQSLLVDLLQGYWTSKKKIIIPTFNSRRGHPVIFDKKYFDELRSASHDVGARSVIHKHSDDVCEVPVNEEGVLINIDTQEDYLKYILKH